MHVDTRTCEHCGEEFSPRQPRRYCYRCLPAYGSVPISDYRVIAVRLNAFTKSGVHGACCDGWRDGALVRYPKRDRYPTKLGPVALCRYCAGPRRDGAFTCGAKWCKAMRSKEWRRTPEGKASKRRQGELHGYRVKSRLVARDGDVCSLCWQRIDLNLKWPDPRSFSVDHVIPRSAGGANTLANLRPAHLVCNQRKGNGIVGAGEQLLLV